MKISKNTLKQLRNIGYELIPDSNPPRFSAGGQFCGGYWEMSLDEALRQLDSFIENEKAAESFLKSQWPTLEGRLSQPITTELEALEQLEKCIPLSKEGKKRLKKLLK